MWVTGCALNGDCNRTENKWYLVCRCNPQLRWVKILGKINMTLFVSISQQETSVVYSHKGMQVLAVQSEEALHTLVDALVFTLVQTRMLHLKERLKK